MAQSKEFFTRIQHKHDIEANWIKAVNFTPLNGEIIVYDKDNEHDSARIKIGDGTTKINELPFIQEASDIDAVTIDIDGAAEGTAMGIDADTFGGHPVNYFITRPEVGDVLSDAMLKTGGEFVGNVTMANTANMKYQISDNVFVLVGHSNGEFVISTNNNGTWNELVRLNEDGSVKNGLLMPKAGGDFGGAVNFKHTPTVYQKTSIADNYPAKINFTVEQTDNNTKSTASIAAYDDHDDGNYGTNMVIQAGGNMIIGSGESPTAYYQANLLDNTSEKTYIVADNNINFVVNANTIANAKTATINTDGGATFAGNVVVGNANSTTDRVRNIECWNAGKTAKVSTNKIVMVRK